MTQHRGLVVGAPVVAAGSGLALLAAHPPVGWWWLTFLHPALLVTALWMDRAGAVTGRPFVRAMRLGLLSGLVAFGPMMGWLIAPAGYIAWGLLVGVQALWLALLAGLVGWFLERPWLPMIAAAAWAGIDAWRATFPLNGFEWGAIAYAHADGSWMLPVARLVGSRGITLLVVLMSVAAAMTIRHTIQQLRARNGGPMEHAFATARLPLALLAGGVLVSVMSTIEPPPADGALDVLVVQGNDIRHWEQPADDPPLTITANLRDETLEAIGDGPSPDLTVWPESSIDRDPTSERGASLAPLVGEAASAAGELISGATMDGPDPGTERYITALRFDGSGQEQDRYVKRRLVPFGEYVPARELLDWFPPLGQIPRDAQPGGDPTQMVTAQGVRLAVVICFETLFTDIVRDNVMAGDEPAGLILSLTNDASFRDSAEPAQHLAQSQLRAVETGRWVVHGSLSGSSAFVDPHGQVHDASPVFERASIRREVPLADGVTPYLVTGDVLGWLSRGAVVALGLFALVVGRRTDPDDVEPGSSRSE